MKIRHKRPKRIGSSSSDSLDNSAPQYYAGLMYQGPDNCQYWAYQALLSPAGLPIADMAQ